LRRDAEHGIVLAMPMFLCRGEQKIEIQKTQQHTIHNFKWAFPEGWNLKLFLKSTASFLWLSLLTSSGTQGA
jgi:hypothetical protein